MPGARLNIKPEPADEYPACEEESQLELHLQRQLEDDIARIFDESIYSDLEVVCGKLKVLTHSCILKARTHKFYHKLQTILHVNIGRNTFDEIYSFISDAYTECNIQHQEREIITYLDNNLEFKAINSEKSKERLEEPDVFLTPKSVSPCVEKVVQKATDASPSTELTKEYYALVPIDGNLLEKELIEQDVLSNAFQSIIKAQTEDELKVAQRKPTSLSLTSSHTSKIVKHSNSCDILNENSVKDSYASKPEQIVNKITSQDSTTYQAYKENSTNDSNVVKNLHACDLSTEKGLDPAYSPDSLITDEPSSSSDYLSAAYTCSPGISASGQAPQLNVGINTAKMENIFTLSDSGLENTAMLGSINSHKEVTLTDVSLSESTLHDLVTDDASNSAISLPSPLGDKRHSAQSRRSGTSPEKDSNGQNTNQSMFREMSGQSSKEEKQRQNEEIVILESSSLSSETGSWESVYPPKFPEKDVCENFLLHERRYCLDDKSTTQSIEHVSSRASPASNKKSTSCFIDAASLMDENDANINIQNFNNESLGKVQLDSLPTPSRPVPCSSNKLDISPIEWSEGNDNDDSLEQAEKKDPDSIQKDLSPTIFEMTPITEDSLCANVFDTVAHGEQVSLDRVSDADEIQHYSSDKERSLRSSSLFMTTTPNNSIMSLKTHRQYESENIKQKKEGDSPPILSGGVSIEDHLPQIGSRENSPLPKWKLENVPIVSGAFVPEQIDSNQESKEVKQRSSSASAWVVDMSIESKSDETPAITKPCEDSVTEKKNIFSIFIDLSEKTTLKDMPARLSSSMNSKKSACIESKSSVKNTKGPNNTINGSDLSKDTDIISNQSVFEKYESLCNDPNISITEIISIPVKHNVMSIVTEDSGKEKRANKVANDTVLSLSTTIQEESTDTNLQSSDLFVKLSDLDKPVQKSDIMHINESKETDVRMTRSIPDNNWCEQPISCNSRSIEVISSFHSENALSLNRLFPHLKNEFSRSMPGSLSSRTRSPLRRGLHLLGVSSNVGDADEPASDMSEMSSMQSSICRSGFGNSTSDSQTSSLIENCTSRLGQDLLRMFLEEIAPDVIVEVSGKRFKAHKCILSSRCQYFAGILSGGWVESLGNVIVLPPFSYNVVYFALCHIYSGLATIPDSVSIVELATIADMLGLEGLKEAIMFTLKARYCHHFHKPCAVCVVGVLECFPLSSVYGLDDLYEKCLKWITKHFSKVWPTKAFATLPTDLLDKCYQRHIVNLTVDGLADTVYGCGIAVASLQESRWAESVARMCRRLINAAANFAAARLSAVLRALAPLPADAPHPAKQALDECIVAAIDWAPPEEACRAYLYLCTLIKDIRNQHYCKPNSISNGTESTKTLGPHNLLYAHAAGWRIHCEGALVRATPRVVGTQAFKDLPLDLRKRLRELGCITYDAYDPTPAPSIRDRKPRSPLHNKNNKCSSSMTRNVNIAQVRASFVPYSQKPVIPPGSREKLRSNNDLRELRKMPTPAPPKVRTTKAQEERAKYNKHKNNKSQEKLNKSPSLRPLSSESIKPMNFKPKICDKKMPVVRKLFLDSSSESSRNSSPIQLRNVKSNPLKTRHGDVRAPAPAPLESPAAASSRPRTAEPSTDSLSESQTSNKYATFTKSKHAPKGSTESIKSKCHVNANSQPQNNMNKMKTKIPVYLNKNTKDPQKRGQAVGKPIAVNNKSIERKVPGSLMNATKSSSAKMVPKVVKDSPSNKPLGRSQKSTHVSRQHRDDIQTLVDIPIMERSGTFLKDEPTFGDRITNRDKDQ